MSGDKPVVILAFANDQSQFLETVKVERQSLSDLLIPYERDGLLQVCAEPSASIDRIFKFFTLYDGQINIFHYGGHANGAALLLEGTDRPELAQAAGLAQLFGRQKELKLVFLNGCATRGQVAALLQQGVKAVIATSAPIDDQLASGFAKQFYDSLAQGHSIGDAFANARTYYATRSGASGQPETCRGLSWVGKPEAAGTDLPWGLYVHDDGEDALDWRLPQLPGAPAVVRDKPPSGPTADWVNVRLFDGLLNSLLAVNPMSLAAVYRGPGGPPPNRHVIWPAIIDAFPSPMGEQIRKLYSWPTVDEERLRQLVKTYEITVKLFCFACLAQLWNERNQRADLVIAEEHRTTLNTFMTLRKDNADTFDYLRLIITVLQIFSDNKVKPFMPECEGLGAELTDAPTAQAHDFMEEMRAELRGDIPANQVASFCEQAETHLATILSDMAFITLYVAKTIKKIEVWKFRSAQARYLYTEVPLDRVSNTPADYKYFSNDISDSGCVVLQKYPLAPNNYLNLAPFIVDENSFSSTCVSNLFFLSYYDGDDDTYRYASVFDPSIVLVVSSVAENLVSNDRQRANNAVKAMFDEFKATVLL